MGDNVIIQLTFSCMCDSSLYSQHFVTEVHEQYFTTV